MARRRKNEDLYTNCLSDCDNNSDETTDNDKDSGSNVSVIVRRFRSIPLQNYSDSEGDNNNTSVWVQRDSVPQMHDFKGNSGIQTTGQHLKPTIKTWNSLLEMI